MKGAAIVLLAIIAAAVAYLAFDQYRERQQAEDLARAMRDPEAFVAEQWAERANMDCEYYRDVVTVMTNSGSLRPTEFTCVTRNFESWRVRDRECRADEEMLAPGSRELASGRPSSERDVFKPLYVICWSVSRL